MYVCIKLTVKLKLKMLRLNVLKICQIKNESVKQNAAW